MSENHFGGNTIPEITREEHQGSINAKRTVVVGTTGTPLDPATSAKQDDIIAELENAYPAGTGDNGSTTLTSANTAYPVPATAPTEKYVIILYNGTANDMYFGYENSNANGILLPAGGRATLDLGASQSIYCYCATAAQAITYSLKEVE